MEYNKGNLEWEIKNKNDENKTVLKKIWRIQEYDGICLFTEPEML